MSLVSIAAFSWPISAGRFQLADFSWPISAGRFQLADFLADFLERLDVGLEFRPACAMIQST
jgi:hypothetical protein